MICDFGQSEIKQTIKKTVEKLHHKVPKLVFGSRNHRKIMKNKIISELITLARK